MSYLVLARKYRPQSFEELVGQEHVTTTLKNALEAKRLAHAYIFSGPRGTGKTTTARILAKALNCVKGPTPTPCGECPQCKEIASGQSPDDVLEIDGASNRGIEQIRELRDTVKYAPARSHYRVYIIDEAHQITEHGFNALLKTLEEPPPHAVFMMATTESQKIPATILSRCQRFQLRAISPADITTQLEKISKAENIRADGAALAEVARAAHGSLRDALSLLDQVVAYAPQGAAAADVQALLGLLPREFVRGFSAVLREGPPEKALAAVQQALADGIDLGQLAEDLLDFHHRILLWKAGVKDPRDPDARDMEKSASLYDQARLEKDLAVLSRCLTDMRRSESPRVTFELACLELSKNLLSVDEILDRLEVLEKFLRSGAPVPSFTPVMAPPVERKTPALMGFQPSAVPAAPPVAPPAPVGFIAVSAEEPLIRTDAARAAWARLLEDIGTRKPSLEHFLLSSSWQVKTGRKLEILCADELARMQLHASAGLIKELLAKHLPGHFVLEVAAAKPSFTPAAPAAAPGRFPLKEESAEEASDEEEGAVVDEGAAPALRESAPADAPPARPSFQSAPEAEPAEVPADPGLQKILHKFPGRLKKLDTPG